MVLAKISREFKNSGISTPSIDASINVSSGSGLPSLVYPFFELDIERDKKHKASLINQETEWFCSFLPIPTS